MKKGIYLVANHKSQQECENLIYTIRESGCSLPIRLIHFGGKEVLSPYILEQVEYLRYENFSDEAKEFILNLRSILTDCPLGFLYRYLAWFSDWDEFIYSDNDVVALCNWETLFEYLNDYDLVHADEEYTTKGKYNYNHPKLIQEIFGVSALESTFTAGHIVVKRNSRMTEDIRSAVNWFKKYPHIPKKHDQSLMHISALLGGWKTLNLCKHPHNWLSSWAGDYKNSLHIIHKIQAGSNKISHIHYSGGTPLGNLAIQEFLFSSSDDNKRIAKITFTGIKVILGYDKLRHQYMRIKRFYSVNKI